MRLGLVKGMGDVQIIPPDSTKDIDLQKQACVVAGGQWLDSPVPNTGCQLNMGPTLPSYCNWVPFAGSLFSDCQLPTSGADLAQYGSYTQYKIGIQSGLDAEQTAVDQYKTEADQTFHQQLNDCDYLATANNPGLAQTFGPSVARMLTNPFSTDCTRLPGAMPGWLLYVALGVGGWFLLNQLTKR